MLVSTTLSPAQQEPLPPDFSYGVIDTIIVSGNEKTRTYVIVDELSLRSGDEAVRHTMEFDKNRIYSLGLFNRVDLWYEPAGSRGVLRVDVSERWHIIPLPIFGFGEGDIKKPYYGAGILHNNFQGKNQKIFGLVRFGYNPSLVLSFRSPQVSRTHNLFFSGSLSFAKILNKSEVESSISGDFDELHYNLNATLGKRLSLYERLGISLGYQIVEVDVYRQGRTVSDDGRDAFILSTIDYAIDSRDLQEYASKGWFFYLAATKYGFGESAVNFTRFNADVRFYTPLVADFVFAIRSHGSIVSGGEVPTYAHAYFGFGERIRGHYDTVLEGENITGASAEIRYDLLTPRIIRFTAFPLPEEFSVWRFGIGLSMFVDTGTTWYRGEGVRFRDFTSGYGAGINFLLPYGIVIRTEYAFSEAREGQFILGLRSSF